MGHKVRPVLKLCNIASSTYYHKRKANGSKPSSKGGHPLPGYSYTFKDAKVPDWRIKRLIMKLLEGEEASYGYRKITICLRRQHGIKGAEQRRSIAFARNCSQ